MTQVHKITRRSFLAGASAGLATPYSVPSRVLVRDERPGANQRIRLGFIGVGDRGTRLLSDFLKEPDVTVTAVCDVWKDHLARAVEKCGSVARPYHDYRELLGREDVDAVVIATPPHWHALQAIHACEAGKDFYLEKPMTLSVGEGLAVRKAVRKYKIMSQIGTQNHADGHYRRVVELIRSGRLGPINVVRTFNMLDQSAEGIGNIPDGDPPDNLDWDLWLGPAPRRPFNSRLVEGAYYHPSFMMTGGWTPGMAPHILDLPYWAMELGHPTSVSSHGGRYVIRDCGDAYDTQDVIWRYPHMTMTWMTSMTNSYGFDLQGFDNLRRRRLGIYFHGVSGTLWADYRTFSVVPEVDAGDKGADGRPVEVDLVHDPEVNEKHPLKTITPSPGHHREWLNSIRTREQPACCVDYHYKIDIAINLAMASLKLGRTIRFDPQSERIIGDAEAIRLMLPSYRDPWELPKEYL